MGYEYVTKLGFQTDRQLESAIAALPEDPGWFVNKREGRRIEYVFDKSDLTKDGPEDFLIIFSPSELYVLFTRAGTVRERAVLTFLTLFLSQYGFEVAFEPL